MRIENDCYIHLLRRINFLSRNTAIYYRCRIQSLIDDEHYNNISVNMSEYEWMDDDERYVIIIHGSADTDKKGLSKADIYIECQETDRRLNHIIDAIGISEEIES